MTDKKTETDNLINKAALDVLLFARSFLMVRFRFLDIALGRLEFVPAENAALATDGVRLKYRPRHVLRCFKSDSEKPARDYLHVVLHCIFSHMFVGSAVEAELWDLACDIAVESVINDMGLRATGSPGDSARNAEIGMLRGEVSMLTAEKIYHYYRKNDLPESEILRLSKLFRIDDHSGWHAGRSAEDQGRQQDSSQTGSKINDGTGHADPEDDDGSEDPAAAGMLSSEAEREWKDIAEKVQDALETLFREQGDAAGEMMQNLREVNREKYDYSAFLRKFAVLGETVGVNDEEFDYIFYTYGLSLYENMPLVEPLEYKEVRRIREFVVAIDTSGSTSGDLVQRFLEKTYNILKSTGSYFSRVNIHIIQCDAVIQEHVKITSEEEFDRYISSMSIKGLGGTDFRPVFSFVDHLIDEGEFTDLRGLIYFTDGCGTFPPRKPRYETAFVFLDNEYNNPDVPPWAIRLLLQDEDIQK